MRYQTDDVRVEQIRPLIPPAILIEEIPVSERASAIIAMARQAIGRCIRGEDDRLVVVLGPCSVHDLGAVEEYAQKLKREADRLAADLLIVMRVYFEKPRTTVGWKGFINDPNLDGSFAINQGLRLGRTLLRDLAELGVPAGCEFLDLITPQFSADLVSWGAIGARTTESQVHRELASGLSCGVGFKNGTDGNIQIAADAVRAAARPHHFLSVTKDGVAAIVATRGNPDCHIILRGAGKAANYAAADIDAACQVLNGAGLPLRLMVDCSHGNSAKDHNRQPVVAEDIAVRIAAGEQRIFGLMVESHLVAGRQDLPADAARGGDVRNRLVYGQSITDACISWDATVPVLDRLAQAVAARRRR
jgi:3-deoxy-7-phosphoheptulonate synthase